MKAPSMTNRHMACDFCRKRKLKCDGLRPFCSACVHHKCQSCVYSDGFKKTGPKRGTINKIKMKVSELEAEIAQLKMERGMDMYRQPEGDLLFDDFTDPQLPSPEIANELLDAMFSNYMTCQIFISEKVFRMQLRGPSCTMPRLSLRFAAFAYAASCMKKYSYLTSLYLDKARFHANRDIDLYAETSRFNHLDTIRALVLISAVACHLTKRPVSALAVSTALRLANCYKYHLLDIGNENQGAIIESDDFTKDLMRRTYWSTLVADRLSSQCTSFPVMMEFRHIRTRLPIDDEKFRQGQPGRCLFLDRAVTSPRIISSFVPSLFSVFCFESYTIVRQLLVKSLDYSEGFDDKAWFHKFIMSKKVLETLLNLLPPLDLSAGWNAANLSRLRLRNAEIALMAVGMARVNECPALGEFIDGTSFFPRCLEAVTEISKLLRTFQNFSWVFHDLGNVCGVFSTARFLKMLVEFQVENYRLLVPHFDLLIGIFHITSEDTPFLRNINRIFTQNLPLKEAFQEQYLEIRQLEVQLGKRCESISTPETDSSLTPQNSLTQSYSSEDPNLEFDNPMMVEFLTSEKDTTFDEVDMLLNANSTDFLQDNETSFLTRQMDFTRTWT